MARPSRTPGCIPLTRQANPACHQYEEACSIILIGVPLLANAVRDARHFYYGLLVVHVYKGASYCWLCTDDADRTSSSRPNVSLVALDAALADVALAMR